MEKYKKASLIALGFYILFSTVVTVYQYSSIMVGRDLYLGTKVILQVWLVYLYFWYKRSPNETAANLWIGIHVVLSNVHGQYFSPWYVFAYVEMIVAYAFLFPLPRRYFNTLLVVGTAAFLAVSLYRYEEVHQWLYTSHPVDLVVITISAAVVAWMCHNFFTVDRTYRDELVRKFGIIGVQSASIIHDIKSMLSAPTLYVDLIKQKLGPSETEIYKLVENLEKQLLNINAAVTGLNQVVALQDQKKETFEIRHIILEVADTLGLSSRQIELEIVGEMVLMSEKALVRSIVFNIMMNAIHAFRKNRTPRPAIRVTCETNVCTISDNAGGFPDEILASIKKSSFDAFDGTGMGLFLIWNGVQSLGGKVCFSNSQEGAQVSMSFFRLS